jgi:hypothetical protein
LAKRLRLLGISAIRAKTGAEARAALADARSPITAIVIPPDPPTLDLRRTLGALSRGPAGTSRPLLVCGPPPDEAARARLREAGAKLALWEPFDDHTLRFQVNRAMADRERAAVPRSAHRVPTHWPVEVRTGRRSRPARLYSLSARGAFLATPGPAQRCTLVHVSLPLAPAGGDPLRLAGEVVTTNVPGNLRRWNLPLGMGLRFLGLRADSERVIERYTEERSLDLLV